MYVFQDPKLGLPKPRRHPYVATKPGQPQYFDFQRHPELIATSLEDFAPLAGEPAVQSFFGFLTWINGPQSILETCDCALRPPESNDLKLSTRLLRVHGRVMLMYRNLAANCDERFADLYNTIGRELSGLDPEFTAEFGAVGFADSRTLFLELMPAGQTLSRFGDPGRGYQLLLQFNGFGDTPAEAFSNLDRVFRNIESACRAASALLDAPATPR